MEHKTYFIIKSIGHRWVIIPALIVLVLAEVLFALILMPGFSEATGGLSALDMQAGFSYQEAYRQIGSYGAQGRTWYNLFQVVDLFFPLAYALFFAGTLAALVKRLTGMQRERGTQESGKSLENKNSTMLRFLPFLPIIGAVFDLFENVGIFSMIRIYPAEFKALSTAVMAAGICKFAFLAASIAVIIILGVILLVRRTNTRKGQAE